MEPRKYVILGKNQSNLHIIKSDEDVLASIGKELDEKENEFLRSSSNDLVRNNSFNVLDDGFINISVIIESLRRMNILLKHVYEEDLIKIISSNHQDIGYICNLQEHWFSIRKIHNTWYVLDSLKSSPLYIKDMNLKFYFNDVIKKYHIFSVQNINPYVSLPKPDINFIPKNINQFYIPTNEISEISGVSDNFLLEDRYNLNKSENYSAFNQINNTPNFRWPENGGRRLNDDINTTNMNNVDDDDDLKIALKLSMEEYIKNMVPPLEETSDENCINVMDLFYWIEYESAQGQDITSSLLFKNNYYLYQLYPRRKFCKYQNGSIELHTGGKTEMVHDKCLKDLNFEKEETFMIS
ncbi:josephin family protein [Plasmodium falciparum IGH-CR14]|uniref:ubiquitinyl hydrolase 1 n=1 Tax=Plasmodium falciparum IGH-CR14 TaxID=580059 RepID=A0A0L1IB08_PLAFA|nr:josephin family protein [Plasmodium falciparum IGH-CR14]